MLVDFWADWCGPCKVLGPRLEALAEEYGGGFLLAKVDTEKEVRLATAFQVQSIPFVVAFKDGRPVDAFMGALPEPKLRDFLDRIGAALRGAAEKEEPTGAAGPLEEALDRIREGDPEGLKEAMEGLSGIEEEGPDQEDARRLEEALSFFVTDPPPGEEAAEALRSARGAWVAKDLPRSMELLLESIAADRGFRDQLARKALVVLLRALEDRSAELVEETRSRLANLLY